MVILGPNCPMKGGEVKEESRIQSEKVVIAVLVVMSKKYIHTFFSQLMN